MFKVFARHIEDPCSTPEVSTECKAQQCYCWNIVSSEHLLTHSRVKIMFSQFRIRYHIVYFHTSVLQFWGCRFWKRSIENVVAVLGQNVLPFLTGDVLGCLRLKQLETREPLCDNELHRMSRLFICVELLNPKC